MKININNIGQYGIADHALVIVVFLVLFGSIGTFILVRGDAATSCAKQSIGVGDRGKCVLDVQEMLNGMVASHQLYPSYNYYGSFLDTDSDFGSNTAGQVGYFQSRFGLIDNGIVGKKTWPKLCYEMDRLPHGAVKLTPTNKKLANIVNQSFNAQANSKCT